MEGKFCLQEGSDCDSLNLKRLFASYLCRYIPSGRFRMVRVLCFLFFSPSRFTEGVVDSSSSSSRYQRQGKARRGKARQGKARQGRGEGRMIERLVQYKVLTSNYGR